MLDKISSVFICLWYRRIPTEPFTAWNSWAHENLLSAINLLVNHWTMSTLHLQKLLIAFLPHFSPYAFASYNRNIFSSSGSSFTYFQVDLTFSTPIFQMCEGTCVCTKCGLLYLIGQSKWLDLFPFQGTVWSPVYFYKFENSVCIYVWSYMWKWIMPEQKHPVSVITRSVKQIKITVFLCHNDS